MADRDPAAIVWFRRDLRLGDNAALTAALESGGPVVACYVHDECAAPAAGGAARWWLHGSLVSLAARIRARGGRLILRSGRTADALARLAAETGAVTVDCMASADPREAALEDAVTRSLAEGGVELRRHRGELLFADRDVTTGDGRPYQVFTPFWKACLALEAPAAPLPEPDTLGGAGEFGDVASRLASECLEDWRLLPRKPDWAEGFGTLWTPGEEGALVRLEAFLDELADYASLRDRPDRDGTSRLSPHLHFGELSPRTVWHAVEARAARPGGWDSGARAFLRELGWREFSSHLLRHWPDLPAEPFRPEFREFPWQDNDELLALWQRGETGYPIVDAGMRQLWQTGWMHNRVRMIVASFLVKDLLVPWQRGAAWFWDTLVDADAANNSASWQWVAGCGADAAPYFRIFNPVLQGRKFDPDGEYVRRWLPSLQSLPARHIHQPWAAPAEVLERGGVTLGRDYPLPIVDHGDARDRALAAYERIRRR